MRRYLRSERVKLPNVDRRRVGGKVYKYHRVTRVKLPSDVPEDHPKFITAWTTEQEKDGKKRITGAPGTLSDACRRYLKSRQYSELSDDYRRVIRKNIEEISEAYGKAMLRGIQPRHIKSDMAKLSANPARQRRKAWRQLFSWAETESLIIDDPSAAVKSPAAKKTDGHLPWTKGEIEAFRNYWPYTSPQRLAFELTFWTGARRGDAARISRRQIGDDGVLVFQQGKTGNPSHVPIYCALPAYADAETHRHLLACLDTQKPELMLITTQTGKPRSPKAMGNWLVSAAKAAGVEGKSTHGLRKSRLTQLAEDSASVHAIMSWGGHVTMSEAQHYIISANRKRAVMGTEQDQNTAQAHDLSAQNAK